MVLILSICLASKSEICAEIFPFSFKTLLISSKSLFLKIVSNPENKIDNSNRLNFANLLGNKSEKLKEELNKTEKTTNR